MALKPMRVLGWNIHWLKRRCEPVASYPALTKVRSLRERCQWRPLSRESAIHQREGRVAAARHRVSYSGLPEGLPVYVPRKPKLLWLCNLNPFYALAALCVIAATAGFLCFLFGAHSSNVWLKTYTLPTAPTFLSEDLALAKAQETIPSPAKPVQNWQPTTAPDGRQDVYLMRSSPYAGIMIFASSKGINQRWGVNVLLESNRLSCTVQKQ